VKQVGITRIYRSLWYQLTHSYVFQSSLAPTCLGFTAINSQAANSYIAKITAAKYSYKLERIKCTGYS